MFIFSRIVMAFRRKGRKELVAPDSLSCVEVDRHGRILKGHDNRDDDLDMEKLRKQFIKYCPDFNIALYDGQESQALEFSRKVLWDISTIAYKVKKGMTDKVWNLTFPDRGTIHIATYKSSKYDPAEDADKKVFTVKEAQLLALDFFGKFARWAWKNDKKVWLTPLADSIFWPAEIEKEFADELGMSTEDLIVAVNQSCYDGSYFLDNSDVNIAYVAKQYGLKRSTADNNFKGTLLSQLVYEFGKRNKVVDDEKIKVATKFANGGIPREFRFEVLEQIFEEGQRQRQEMLSLSKTETTASKQEETSNTKPESVTEESPSKHQVDERPSITKEIDMKGMTCDDIISLASKMEHSATLDDCLQDLLDDYSD